MSEFVGGVAAATGLKESVGRASVGRLLMAVGMGAGTASGGASAAGLTAARLLGAPGGSVGSGISREAGGPKAVK